jgi:hypothetical protein
MCTTTKQRRPKDDRKYSWGIYSNRKFQQANDFDFDRNHYIYEFSGRMTKERYKKLDSFCRLNSRPFRYRCGHDWDCCGCIFAVSMSFEYRHNQVTVHLTHHRNY